MNSYQQFYRAQIERARDASPTIAGLIPINGPTGLGKTSALFNSSQEGSGSVLSYLTDAKLQGIFITHRWNILHHWNILHQVTKDAQAQGIAVSVLYARQDQVLGAVLGRPFAHEDPESQPGDWQIHLASLTAEGLWVNTLFSSAQLRELCSVITRQSKQIASLASLADAKSLKQSAQQKLNYSCKQLETAVQQNLRQLELQHQAQGKPRGKRRRQLGVNILTESPLQQFRAHAWIRRLLPAVAWHDEQQPLLIMTTQKFFIEVQDDYYDYQLDDLKQHAGSLAIKLAVCIKELHFKQLMRDTQARISDYLPQHAAHLSDISLIAEGCLFTVQDDRPLVVPLTLSDPIQLARCNAILARHHMDGAQLLQRLITHWPYGFGPQAAITDDVDKFIKSQVILLQGNTHIFLQSPQQHTPMLTPKGLTDLMPLLIGRQQSYPLSSWRLPSEFQDKPSPIVLRELLVAGDTATDNALHKLLLHLPQLCRDWQYVIAQHNGQSMISFDPLRKAFNDQAKHCLGGDKQILGLWWQWLSATLYRPVYEPRVWLRTVPGLSGLWLDEKQGVYLVGELSALKLTLIRQPSIYRWHTLRGQLNADTLMPLLDVDFVRMGSLAGRVYPHLFIRLFNELNK